MMPALLLLAAMADPDPLAPTGKWHVEYAATMCVLSRDYGTGADGMTFALSTVPTNLGRDVALVTRGNAPSGRGAGSVTLLPGGRPISGTYQRSAPSGTGTQITKMFVAEGALDGLDKASAIEIRLGDERRTLANSGIGTGLAALSKCHDDLLKSWGIDPGERAREATHVTGNPGRFFGVSAYPPEAVSAHAQGLVISVVGVDPRGGVASCTVVASSGNKALDDGTCRIIREQVHLIPARDKDGNGVASHYVLPVRWVLPAG